MRGQWLKFHKIWRPVFVAAFILLFALALAGRSGFTQQQNGPSPPTPPFFPPRVGPAGRGTPPQDIGPDQRTRERMARMRNEQRQEQLVKDTDKLFDLAKELKSDVAKTNKDTLSVDVVKKAEEIEKLAKSVRDKMRSE